MALERDALALELAESRAVSKDALLRTRAAEHKLLELTTELDAVLRFFPAQFPEASGLVMAGGRICVAAAEGAADGRPRELSVRTALLALRRGLDDQKQLLQVARASASV